MHAFCSLILLQKIVIKADLIGEKCKSEILAIVSKNQGIYLLFYISFYLISEQLYILYTYIFDVSLRLMTCIIYDMTPYYYLPCTQESSP